MNPQFLGYKYTITYNDFERQTGIMKDINYNKKELSRLMEKII